MSAGIGTYTGDILKGRKTGFENNVINYVTKS